MPSGEGPWLTKRAMLIDHQSSALPCRAAAQFNKALHRTAICAWGFPLEFCGFIRQVVAVGELGRSLRREVASTTAERGLVLTQPCLSRQVFYGSRRLAGGSQELLPRV